MRSYGKSSNKREIKSLIFLDMKKVILRFWPVAFIFVVWFIFASPYFFKGLVPFPSKYLVTFFPPWSAEYGMPVKNNAMPDVITQIYPWKRLTIETWKMGQVPLWNPYSFSGTPHLANYQSAVLSPVNLLFFIFSEIDAWSIMILLQPLLAGLFTYFFLRTLARSQAGSLIGSVAFMLCGFMTVWMAYGTLGWAILWLPFLLAVVVRHFKKRSWWNIVAISLTLAWSFFSGHFQMSTYVFIVLCAFIFYKGVRQKSLKTGAELLAAIAIGLCLSAPQILPSLEAYQNSLRSQLFTQSGGIAWQYLITIFSPDFYGNPVTRNDWFGQYAEWASYIGVVPFLLSIYALFRKKFVEVWFFVGLALVSLLVATPSPLNSLIIFLKLPALSTSYNARAIILVSFALSVLAAYGVDGLSDDWQKHRFKAFIPFAVFGTLILIILWGILYGIRPFPMDKLLIAKRNIVLPTALSIVGIALFFFGFLRKPFVKKLVLFALIGLTAFDMLRYATKWMPFDPRAYIYPETKTLNFLQKEVGTDRIFGNLGGEVGNGFSLPMIEGYDAVYQKRYGEFVSSISDGKIRTSERSVVKFPKKSLYGEKILQLLGVTYDVQRLSDGRFPWAYPYWQYPYYKSIYKDEHYEVFRNENAFPRVFLASSYKIETDNQRILDILYEPTFDAKKTVVLEEKPNLQPRDGEGSAAIMNYSPNEITLKTSSTVPKLLFLSDVHDKGWKATIDKISTRVYRADYDFRAIAVQSGQHNIRLYYWPDSFVHALWFAGIGIVILIVGSFKKIILKA